MLWLLQMRFAQRIGRAAFVWKQRFGGVYWLKVRGNQGSFCHLSNKSHNIPYERILFLGVAPLFGFHATFSENDMVPTDRWPVAFHPIEPGVSLARCCQVFPSEPGNWRTPFSGPFSRFLRLARKPVQKMAFATKMISNKFEVHKL